MSITFDRRMILFLIGLGFAYVVDPIFCGALVALVVFWALARPVWRDGLDGF